MFLIQIGKETLYLLNSLEHFRNLNKENICIVDTIKKIKKIYTEKAINLFFKK